MNLLARNRSKVWSYRLRVKCRRNKLYCKIEREREREKGVGSTYRERDSVKGRGIDRVRESERENISPLIPHKISRMEYFIY